MKKFVVMSGGFHPFHAGHASLYQQAKEKFPDATVLVCATNVQEERPFPFSLKKKLAQLSGVPPKDFIEVSRQFSVEDPALAQRIGDPSKAAVIFVRSDKDKNEPPIPYKPNPDGSPVIGKRGKPLSDRLLDYPGDGQPLTPASKHVYMDYLKTVEFGPGITSASKIREMWPKLNDKRKLAMVMSLYPATQKNPKLAQNVVGMFDQVMGGQVSEGEVVPFKKPQPLSWEQLPKDVLRLANDWYWAEQDNSGVDALMDPKGFGSGTNNDLKYITAKLQQLGWGIDYNDEYDGPGEFNLRLTNKRGQTVLLSIEDAQDFKGWAKGTNSLNEDAGTEFILYINGKPAAKYNELHQAERDVGLIQNKNPNAKFEIKKEVCNLVSVPIGLKEALLREFVQDVQETIKPDQLAKLQQYKSELQRKQDAQRNAPLSPEKQQELDQWMRDFQASHGSRTVAQTQQAPAAQEPQKADWRTLPRQTRGKIKTQKQKLESLIRIGEKINIMISRAERFPGGIPPGIQSDIETLENSYDENNPDYDTMIEIYTKVANELEQFINMKRALYRKSKTPRYESAVEDVLETIQQNPLIDLTPNFPNYSKLIGEFVGVQNNKIALKIIDAILKPGNKPAEKIVKAIENNSPIVMAPHYVKNRKVVSEFAPSDDGDDQEEFFFKMAKQWWLGTEQQMMQVVKTLDKMGYEIGEDTGYDDGGVFIVKSGDQNGGSYMSWSHEDLSGLNEAANAAQQAAIDINMKKQGKKPKTNESVDYLEEK